MRLASVVGFIGVSSGLLFLGACETASEFEVPVRRDSLLIEIVEHGILTSGTSAVRLSDRALLRFGGESQYPLQSVRYGALGPEGGVVIGDTGSQEVLRIGRDGELRAILGGIGEGPGEIGRLGGVSVLDDGTVVVKDNGNGRFSLFQNDTLVASVPATVLGIPALFSVIGTARDSRVLLSPVPTSARFEEPWRVGHVVSFNLKSVGVDTLVAFDWLQRLPDPPNPFRPEGHVEVAGDRLVVGRSDRPELRWFSFDGDLLQVVRWVAEPRAVTDSVWAIYEQINREMMQIDPEVLTRRLAVARQGAVDPLPLYDGLMGSHAGETWVPEYTPSTMPPRSYLVVSADGEWLGPVEVPERFRLLDIGRDRVLGVLADEFGVESVVIYGIERGT